MRNELAKLITQKTKENKNFFLVAGDAGLGLWDNYQKEFKEQYLNPGINEAASIGLCAGLSLAGKKVLYYNICNFTLMRPYEQVRNDICYQELPIILVGIGCGLTYAPCGMTHYAIEDIALALTCPNLQIFSPCDSLEVKTCFEYAYKSQNPSYIRIAKSGEEKLHTKDIDDISSFQLLKNASKDILLISHSTLTSEVIKAANELNASVISIPFINSTNEKIKEFIKTFKHVFVVEEHFKYGGLGTFLKAKLELPLKQIALKDKYIHEIGNQNFIRKHYGLDYESLIKTIKEQI